jgi:hypothetical protein
MLAVAVEELGKSARLHSDALVLLMERNKLRERYRWEAVGLEPPLQESASL